MTAACCLVPFVSRGASKRIASILASGAMLMAAAPELPYRNSALPTEARVADLLSRMTLEEKVAQLSGSWNSKPIKRTPGVSQNLWPFDPTMAAKVYANGIGSISRQQEHKGPREAAIYSNDVQLWLRDHTRLGIPAFFHDEVLHGHMAQGGTHFPQTLSMACSWDPELIHRVFTSVALEVRARGGHQALGPNLDLGWEPRWGRTEETYGEDPYLVTRMTVSAIKALQGDGTFKDNAHVMATMKHFAAHSQPEGGINCAPAVISERMLRDTVLKPFEAAVKEAHIWSAMPSYNEIDGVPSHVNRWLMDTVLRKEWGFEGFTVADYGAVSELARRHHVATNIADAGRQALEAGVDQELPEPICFKEIPKLVKDGSLPVATVDQAVSRVLRAKFVMGLFENPLVDADRAAKVVNSTAHQALALEAAQRSVTLLRNEGGLLPLDAAKLKTVAVVGPNAAKVHLGGYSDDPGRGVSVLQGIQNRLGSAVKVLYAEGCRITEEGGRWYENNATLPKPAEEDARIAQAVDTAKQSDVVVLVLGSNEDTNKEGWADNHLGDRDTIELFGRQMDLARAVLATGKPVVVFLNHSGPLAIPELAEKAPAILTGFYLGQETGTAAASVLFGDVNPSGKLPITFPRSTGQIPAFYNRKPTATRGYLFTSNKPVFPFGFGLSYTTFSYADAQVEPSRIRAGERATVNVTVQNTGTRAGDEIVQLYLRDDVSSVTRPIQELAGFQRVSLKPGEKTTVKLMVGPEAMTFTGVDMKRTLEPGTFTLMVGPSSSQHQDVKLEVLP